MLGLGGGGTLALEHLGYGQQSDSLASQPTCVLTCEMGTSQSHPCKQEGRGQKGQKWITRAVCPLFDCQTCPLAFMCQPGDYQPLPLWRARPWHYSTFQKDTEHLACGPVPTPQSSPLQTLGTQPFPLIHAPACVRRGALTGKLGSSCRSSQGICQQPLGHLLG